MWIAGYFTGALGVPDIIEKAEAVMPAIQDAITAAPEDFAALSGMDLMKAVKSVKDIGGDCVKIVKEIISSCKRFANDAKELATAIPEVVKDIQEGKIKENGKKCSDAGKEELYDCYALIYGPLKKGKGGDGEGGCCTIF